MNVSEEEIYANARMLGRLASPVPRGDEISLKSPAKSMGDSGARDSVLKPREEHLHLVRCSDQWRLPKVICPGMGPCPFQRFETRPASPVRHGMAEDLKGHEA